MHIYNYVIIIHLFYMLYVLIVIESIKSIARVNGRLFPHTAGNFLH